MTVVWTPPTHAAGGESLTVSRYNLEVVDNLQFLHDGFPLMVGGPGDLSSILVPTANTAYGIPVRARDQITIAGLTYRSSSTAGNIDVGVYVDDLNGTTATKLKSSGSTAMPAGASAHTINFSAAQTLDPYVKYWLVVAMSSGSARLLGTDGPYTLISKTQATAFPLPATFTFSTAPSVSPCLWGLA